MTEVLFVNHASLLIKHGDQYLLTDPWFEKPAFGSWLPSYPPSIHPAYLASLDNLSILISHGHDDHCDDDVLSLFDRDTAIISRFPWVGERVKNKLFVGCNPRVTVSCFTIRSHQTEPADAIYTIETPDALIIHANDNWNVPEAALEAIKADVERIGPKRTLYCSQVGSASGWPLNYRCYSDDEKQGLLLGKIRKMAETATKNCEALGLDGFASYAGYALPFVEGRDYISQGIHPSPVNIKAIAPGAKVMSFYPGDTWDGEIKRPMWNNRTSRIAEKAERFYRLYDKVPSVPDGRLATETEYFEFWESFREFAIGSFPTLEDKTFAVYTDEIGSFAFDFADPTEIHCPPDKLLWTDLKTISAVIRGELLFESLYTGYLGEWERNPKDVHNSDIVDAIVAFSYRWQDKVRKERA